MILKRCLSALIVACALSATLAAVSYTKFEAVTVAAASIGFTAANINNLTGAHPPATQAVCSLETAQIRYTLDGSTPSASAGVIWDIGTTLQFNGNDTLNNFRAFRTGASSGQLNCHYFGSY